MVEVKITWDETKPHHFWGCVGKNLVCEIYPGYGRSGKIIKGYYIKMSIPAVHLLPRFMDLYGDKDEAVREAERIVQQWFSDCEVMETKED